MVRIIINNIIININLFNYYVIIIIIITTSSSLKAEWLNNQIKLYIFYIFIFYIL